MKVLELFSDPSTWVQGAYAANKEGIPLPIHDPFSVSFCLVGAISKCYKRDTKEFVEVEAKVLAELGSPISYWNDEPGRTFQEVLDLVTKLDI